MMNRVEMNEEMMAQVNGGNILNDAWDFVKNIPNNIEDAVKWAKKKVEIIPVLPDKIEIAGR